jgi:hypothetical protein
VARKGLDAYEHGSEQEARPTDSPNSGDKNVNTDSRDAM